MLSKKVIFGSIASLGLLFGVASNQAVAAENEDAHGAPYRSDLRGSPERRRREPVAQRDATTAVAVESARIHATWSGLEVS